MPPAALAIVSNEPAPDRLAGLLSEAAALRDEFQRLAEQRARLEAFGNEESAIMAEIGDIGRREVEAVKAWAADPQGNPPSPLVKEREKLAHKLAAAQANAGAAGVAVSEIDAKQRKIHQKQLELEPQIVGEICNRLESEYCAGLATLKDQLQAARRQAAHVGGLFDALRDQAQHLQGAGKIDDAIVIFQRLERLEKFDLLSIGPTEAEIAREAVVWRERAAALRGGAA